MAVSLDEVNYLITMYLKESGFPHTAFVFQTESMSNSSSLNDLNLPPGSLVSILQKSLRYMQMEKQIKEVKKDKNNPLHNEIIELEEFYEEKAPPPPPPPPAIIRQLPVVRINKPLDVVSIQPSVLYLNASNSCFLNGHQNVAFCCHWAPNGEALATGGDNGTGYIWELRDGVNTNQIPLAGGMALQSPGEKPAEDLDITSIDWASHGGLIATGSYDKKVRIYNRNGQCLAVLSGHSHPVFCVRFNRSGTLLVSCSQGESAILWETATFKMVRSMLGHANTVVDVAWCGDDFFATASADGRIGVWKADGTVYFLESRAQHVISVSWSLDGQSLAAGCDDGGISIWRGGRLGVLKGHTDAVNFVRWLPNGGLVSGGNDHTLRLWSSSGDCIHNITRHSGTVMAVDVSPNGEYIASGDSAGMVLITKCDGTVCVEFRGGAMVNDLRWDPSGRFVAVCFGKGAVAVIRVQLFLK